MDVESPEETKRSRVRSQVGSSTEREMPVPVCASRVGGDLSTCSETITSSLHDAVICQLHTGPLCVHLSLIIKNYSDSEYFLNQQTIRQLLIKQICQNSRNILTVQDLNTINRWQLHQTLHDFCDNLKMVLVVFIGLDLTVIYICIMIILRFRLL